MGAERLPSRAMDVWYLHCLFSTAFKITDCNYLSCEAEGQCFSEGVIFVLVQVSIDFDMWNCNIETSVQFLHTESCRYVGVEL